MRVPVLLLLVVAALASPALFPYASAQTTVTERVFAVRDVARNGMNVSVTLTNVNVPVIVVTATLIEGNRLAATPERTRDSWQFKETVRLDYVLLRDVDSVKIRVTYSRGDGKSYEETIPLDLPPLPKDHRKPRVEVVDARVREDVLANVTLLNMGNRTSGIILVSLEDLQGVRVGTPFVRPLPELAPGDSVEVPFTLAKAIRDVRVVLEYDNRTNGSKVHLRDEEGTTKAPKLVLKTELPSRESQPGKSVDFTLSLKNEGSDAALVDLTAEGLPEGYVARWFVQNSAIPRVEVPAGGTRNLQLSVALPASATGDVGATLPLVAVATSGGLEARTDLALTVRGEPKLEVGGRNWHAEIGPGERAEVSITVKNVGSATVRDVDLAASTLTGWRIAFDPPRVAKLDPGAEATVMVEAEAPADAGSGRYVFDVTATAGDVTARPRTVSLEVALPEASRLPWVLGASAAGLLATFLVVRVKRR